MQFSCHGVRPALTVNGFARQQYVLWLQVEMGDRFAVHVLEGAQNFPHADARLLLRQVALLVDQCLQLATGRSVATGGRERERERESIETRDTRVD